MRVRYRIPADAAELEQGCVDWFDYDRYRKVPRGRHCRPRVQAPDTLEPRKAVSDAYSNPSRSDQSR
ncbi:MAG TPA: hypothetical protein VN660_05455 [Steroidobacteraceae bacterium]|nr:hypothetical protein [Steroidobacteraceae bacterium]